eukprot:jgi/Ulvmu1/5812/UM025_0069.1
MPASALQTVQIERSIAPPGSFRCRAVIHRGALRHAQRTTIAGHAFTLLHEDGTPAAAPSLRIDSREYLPRTPAAPAATPHDQADPVRKGSPQEIFVPFPASTHEVTAILCDAASAISVATVVLHSERFKLTMAGNPLDAMALVPGSTALLPIRASLTLNDSPAPLSLLHGVTLTITTTDKNGAEATTTFRDFPLRELPHAAEQHVRIPEGCRRVAVELAASVTHVARGDNGEAQEERLTQQACCDVASGSGTDAIAGAHLSLSPASGSGAIIQVLGRCGEPVPGVPVTLQLKHWAWGDPADTVKACTDDGGCIEVQSLQGLQWIRLRNDGSSVLPERYQRTWHLRGLEPAATWPRVLESGSDNWLQLPLDGIAGAAMLDAASQPRRPRLPLPPATPRMPLCIVVNF